MKNLNACGGKSLRIQRDVGLSRGRLSHRWGNKSKKVRWEAKPRGKPLEGNIEKEFAAKKKGGVKSKAGDRGHVGSTACKILQVVKKQKGRSDTSTGQKKTIVSYWVFLDNHKPP